MNKSEAEPADPVSEALKKAGLSELSDWYEMDRRAKATGYVVLDRNEQERKQEENNNDK